MTSSDPYTLLIAASLDENERAFYERLVTGAEYVVAVDGGLTGCRWTDRAPDLLVGDLDSVSEADLRWLDEYDTTLITAESRKDFTDLELARDRLPAGDGDLVVTGVLGGRLDHELAALAALFRSERDFVRISGPHAEAWVMCAPGTLHLSGDVGTTVSLLAWEGECRVTTSGLEYGLDGDVLDHLEPRGVSNLLAQPRAEITLHMGRLLVVTPVLDVPRPIGYAIASAQR
jgi:thiamine pyrophosphokinase